MKVSFFSRRFFLVMSSFAAALLITACSGSSTSSSGGGAAFGKATIVGNVQGGVALYEHNSGDAGLLVKALEFSVQNASAANVSGVTVVLLKDGAPVGETTTDGGGNFSFSNLEPGNYSIQVAGSTTDSFALPGNSRTTIVLNLDGDMLQLEVEVEDDGISGELEDESSDDLSEDDVSEDSEDDISEDSEDDVSEEDSEDEGNQN